MKQNLLKTWLMLVCLLVGVGTGWAADADYTLTPSAGSNNAYTGNCDVTVGDITWNVTGNASMVPWRLGGRSITEVDRTVYSKTPYTSAVSKVDLTVGAASSITVNSLKLVYSTNSDFSNSSEISKSFSANSTISFEGDFPANAYYKFVLNVTVSGTSNKFVEFSKVEFYNKSNGGTDPTPTEPFSVTFNAGNNGSCSTSSLTEASAGAGVTLPSATANDGYVFKGWATTEGATTANAGAADANYKPSADCTLYAVYARLYTYNFYVNGTSVSSGSVEEGTNITVPSDPEDINGKKFVGWVSSEITSPTDTKPSLVTPAKTMGTDELKYYAVFAASEGGTVYKLVNSPAAGKDYVFVTRNTAGEGYALSSSITTGTAVTIIASGDDKIIDGTPADAIIWTKSLGLYGQIPGSFTIKNKGTEKYMKINGTSIYANDATYPCFWDTSKGLYGKSSTGTGNTSYYLQSTISEEVCTFYKAGGSTTNRVYAYEATGGTNYSDYCTTVGDVKSIDHINVSGEYKKLYKVGDTFDDANMTVTVCYDETETDTKEASKYTVDKTTALTTSNTTWRVSYTENGNTVNADVNIDVVALDHITITNPATTTEYFEGENFDKTGLTVSATWGTEPGKIITEENIDYTVTDGENLTVGKESVTVSYTSAGTTKNATQEISVRSVSISAPVVTEEGSYTVKVGDAEAVTADGSTIAAKKGQKIVLASTPATGYKAASTPFVVKDEDENEVSVSTAGGQYSFTMPGKNVTITAQFSRVYSITKGSFEHGEITAIKDKDGATITETSKGSKVVVEASEETHWNLTSMYYIKEGEETQNAITETEGVYSFTMPQSNITVYATYTEDAKYNVAWVVNGRESKTEEIYGDVAVSAPSVSAVNGKVFRGWVEAEINGTTDTEPSFVNVANLTVSEDKTYYAVFADASDGGEGSVEFDVNSIESIQQSIAQRTQTTDGITFTFSSVGSTGTNNNTVQMSKSSTLTQDVPFAGCIKSITFEGFGYSSTKDAAMLIEGKSGIDGTYATVQSCGSTYNGSEISFGTNDYDMFKISVGSERTVKFTKMTVSYSGVNYSDYCTTVAPITIDAQVTTGTDKAFNVTGNANVVLNRSFNDGAYNSLVLPFDMSAEQIEETFGSDTKIYNYTGTRTNEDKSVTLLFDPAETITANLPVFIYGATSAENKLIAGVTIEDGETTITDENGAYDYVGVYAITTIGVGDKYIGSGNTIKTSANGTTKMQPTRAYFAKRAGGDVKAFSINDEATGIILIENGETNLYNGDAYNLSGQKVSAKSMKRGVYVVGGRKVVIK